MLLNAAPKPGGVSGFAIGFAFFAALVAGALICFMLAFRKSPAAKAWGDRVIGLLPIRILFVLVGAALLYAGYRLVALVFGLPEL